MKFTYEDIVFNGHLVLKKGCIKINNGQITAITGESGSGKTSLFNLMVNHHEYWDDNIDLYKHVSLCQQVPLFLNNLTLLEHCQMIKEITHTSINLEKYIDKLELNDVMDKYPHELSGGEQKRAAFLLCLYKDADVYILDEPTSSLNNEYSLVYCEILNELKKRRKSVILFTHDESLLAVCDIHYHIEDKELHLIQEEAGSKKGLGCYIMKELDGVSAYFKKMKHHNSFLTKFLDVFLIAAIALVGIGYCFNQNIHQLQESSLSAMQSNELVIFKASPHAIINGVGEYTYDNELPFTDDEIESIGNIDHIEALEWRYDFLEPDYNESNDITLIPYDCEAESQGYCLTLKEGEEDRGMMDIHDDVAVCSYLKEYKQESDIDVDFENDGVFISRELADDLKEVLNSDDDQDFNGLSIKMDIAVPLYNTFGRWQGEFEDGTFDFIYNTTITHETVTLPIGGILKDRSFGLQCYVNYSIYVERDVIENLINENKRDEERLLYVYGQDYGVYSINSELESADEEPNRIFEDQPYSPTAYSVYVDGIENIAEVTQDLEDLGLTVLSGYSDTMSYYGGIFAMKDLFFYGSLMLAFIIVVYRVGTLFVQDKKEKGINDYFKQLGLKTNEIKDIRQRYYLSSTITAFEQIVIMFALLYGIVYLVFSLLLTISMVSIVLVILLTIICFYVLPPLINKVN